MRNTEKLKVINRDIIKYIAVFLMFWGHLLAWAVRFKNPGLDVPYGVMPMWQRLITHLSLFCPPVMFFMAADGYKYTRDRKKYAVRLLVFACITQPFHWLLSVPSGDGWWTSNVIFTLFFGLLCIIAWENKYTLKKRVLLIILLNAASLLIFSDWFIFGCMFILFLHIYRGEPKKRFIAYTATALVWKGISVSAYLFGSGLSASVGLDEFLDFAVVMLAYLCMTVFYNGRKGGHPVFAKWFFYVFYPAHYLVIYAAAVSGVI